MKQKNTILITVISLLLLLALVGAGLLSSPGYRDMILKVFPFLIVAPAKPPPAPPAYAAPQRNLTREEQKALDIPLHNASAEEKTVHAEGIAKLVKTAPALDVTGCKPDPLVYRVDLKGSFTVKNNDPIPHTIRYSSIQIEVPAQSTTTVKTSQLFQKAGDYGYGCDNPFAKMGVLMVR